MKAIGWPMEKNNLEPRRGDQPEGRYADQFKIGYKPCVFLLDFDQSFYENEKQRVLTRIITSPEALKSFLALIKKSLDQYEQNHGPICVEGQDKPGMIK